MKTRHDFRFFEPLRVRWAEVDMQKIVFNGHYLTYFDTAVAGYWRALALPYHDTMAQLRGDLFVRKATLEYEGPVHYDERLHVGVRCAHIGNSSMRFAAAVFRGIQCRVHGELVYVFADPIAHVSRPVPPSLRTVLTDYEAGASVFTLQLGTWAGQAAAAQVLRHAVFAQEQGIAADLMSDAADTTALHALVINRLGMPVASGRLLLPQDGIGRIGRMAVHAGVRGAGLGQAVLQALIAAAQARGDSDLMLHAQSAAVGFYQRAGFTCEGPVFEEAGIAHQAMRRRL